jgi:hypothetical protein
MTKAGRNSFIISTTNLPNSQVQFTTYDEIVSWIEDEYHAWVAKDHYGSTRLLLLSFGLVGLIGIRRKFKKS